MSKEMKDIEDDGKMSKVKILKETERYWRR